jgi:hypothetical protein
MPVTYTLTRRYVLLDDITASVLWVLVDMLRNVLYRTIYYLITFLYIVILVVVKNLLSTLD